MEEAGDAEAGLSDGVDEPVQAGSKRVKAATGTGMPTPPPPAPVVDTAKTPVHQKNGTSVLGMLKRQDPKGESPRVTAAASSSAPAASAAAVTAGEASSAGDVVKTPAASKDAFSALMSSSKVVNCDSAPSIGLSVGVDCISILNTHIGPDKAVSLSKNAFATLMQSSMSTSSKPVVQYDENGWEICCHVCGKKNRRIDVLRVRYGVR